MSTGAIPQDILDAVRERLEPKGVLPNIGGPNGLSLILYLDDNSPVMKTKLYSEVSKTDRTMKRLQYLLDEHLVEVVYAGRLNASFFVITVKGRAVAKHIRRLIYISAEQ